MDDEVADILFPFPQMGNTSLTTTVRPLACARCVAKLSR